MMRTKPISGELKKLQIEIDGYAKDYGLDYFDVVFEMCDYDTINILAAQGGFPSRYPHWRFGMDYDQLSKNYAYGLQKIYEMVINTDPVYAYLLTTNDFVDQKLVMAHVFGHADFFKNNAWFKNTDRKMMDVMANHSTKIRRYMEKYGVDKVESFIDKVLSIENLIDVGLLFESNHKRKKGIKSLDDEFIQKDERTQHLQSYLRTKKRIESQDDIPPLIEPEDTGINRILENPQRDIMLFLMEHAPIPEWQADIIGILREEAYYFLPQGITKIMNEGWASYWHSTIMTQKAMRSSEIIDFADRHSGVMQMSKQQINPYKVGIELMRDIEYRWDTGRFGKEYTECENLRDKENWNLNLGKGREKIFDVRKSHNDITFIDEFLTMEFCERAQLFTYKYNPRSGRFEIDTRDFLAIKQKLLTQLTNFGQPTIDVVDANYANRGELLLTHRHDGVDLDANYAAETMRNLYGIWKRPINLRTTYDDKEVTFHFNGKEMKPL